MATKGLRTIVDFQSASDTSMWLKELSVTLSALKYIQIVTGVPTAAPTLGVGIALRTDGGVGSTLYVYEGGAWAAK